MNSILLLIILLYISLFSYNKKKKERITYFVFGILSFFFRFLIWSVIYSIESFMAHTATFVYWIGCVIVCLLFSPYDTWPIASIWYLFNQSEFYINKLCATEDEPINRSIDRHICFINRFSVFFIVPSSIGRLFCQKVRSNFNLVSKTR